MELTYQVRLVGVEGLNSECIYLNKYLISNSYCIGYPSDIAGCIQSKFTLGEVGQLLSSGIINTDYWEVVKSVS